MINQDKKFHISFQALLRILSKFTDQADRIKISSSFVDNSLILSLETGRMPGNLLYNTRYNYIDGCSRGWLQILEETRAQASDLRELFRPLGVSVQTSEKCEEFDCWGI